MATDDIAVSHNESKSQFEAKVDGKVSVAGYKLSPGTITFTHTSVPEELNGRGIAGKIVAAGLDYARSKGLKVVPQCPYVAKYMERHPEYNDLRA
jgi:uncharacterized protein